VRGWEVNNELFPITERKNRALLPRDTHVAARDEDFVGVVEKGRRVTNDKGLFSNSKSSRPDLDEHLTGGFQEKNLFNEGLENATKGGASPKFKGVGELRRVQVTSDKKVHFNRDTPRPYIFKLVFEPVVPTPGDVIGPDKNAETIREVFQASDLTQ